MPAFKIEIVNSFNPQQDYCSELWSVKSQIPAFQNEPDLTPYTEHNNLPDTQVTKDTGILSFFQCPVCHKSDM